MRPLELEFKAILTPKESGFRQSLNSKVHSDPHHGSITVGTENINVYTAPKIPVLLQLTPLLSFVDIRILHLFSCLL